MNGQNISNKEQQEVIDAINKITTSLIILKTISDKYQNWEQFSYINPLNDKISKEFEKIADKY